MKTKKHRNRRNLPNPVARGFPPAYEPSFKRSVILYAEQKSNQEARKRFGISEETIKRWRKLRQDIMEKAQQCIRRSQRHAMGHGSFSEKSIEKEKGIIEDAFEDDPKKDLDSMPLQQRLSQNHNESAPSTAQAQESQLHSLPISPTKLKVTRQGKPQQHPTTLPTPPSPAAPSQVCLKWNSHHKNMQAAFPNLLTKEQYVDATLVSEGKTLKCHRMILSSCSPYFEEVLNGISPFQHPVLFMKDIPFWALKALCDFMYAGEVHILQDKLQELLNVAASLKVKGLGGPPDCNEEATTPAAVREIKKEIDHHTPSPAKPFEKAVKEEKDEELPVRVPRYDPQRYSRKREDKRSKHTNQSLKDKVLEEPKGAMKIAPNKAPPAAKTTVKNLPTRNSIKTVPKPSRKSETKTKHKIEPVLKEKEKPPLKKGNINDPLDLLQPVYEEIAKEEPPWLPKGIAPGKIKERGNVSVKRGMTRRVRKRRYADYVEDRDESPPPLFQSRKGTRSRPNVKIPKYFHTHFDDSPKETVDATIVREPHTDQNDPLIAVELEEIKAEPLDVEENTIELEEGNLENFVVPDQEMISQEGEEIIGNYDSPLVNIKIEPKRNTPNIFKKVLDSLDIQSVTDTNVRLLDIKEENVQFVDISRLSTGDNQIDSSENQSEIIISSVQSMAEITEEGRKKEPKCDNNFKEKDLKTYAGVGVKPLESLTSPKSSTFAVQEENNIPSGQIPFNLPSTEDDPLAQTADSHSPTLQMRIEDVRSEKSQTLEPNGSLGSLEAKMETLGIQRLNNSSQSINNIPDSSEAESDKGVEIGPPEAAEIPPEIEASGSTTNIEAELEQCLASTSYMAPRRMDLDDDEEDFTKDIEFESFGTPKTLTVISPKHQASSEEEQIMEETLLADLEDDIMMKNGSSQDEDDDDDGSEKTLEMIVNDLNESLGEMRK